MILKKVIVRSVILFIKSSSSSSIIQGQSQHSMFFTASCLPSSARLIQTLNKRTLIHLPFINFIAYTCIKWKLLHIAFAHAVKYVSQRYFASSNIVFVPSAHPHIILLIINSFYLIFKRFLQFFLVLLFVLFRRALDLLWGWFYGDAISHRFIEL